MFRWKNIRPLGRDNWDIVTIGRVLVPLVVVLVWAILSAFVGSQVLSPPQKTLETIITGFTSGWLKSNLFDTLTAVALAYLIGVGGGITLGLILGGNNKLYRIFEVYILSAYAVPKIIFFPVFLLLFGVTLKLKVGYGALSGFFPMLIVTMSAIREVDEIYLDVADSLRLSRWQRFRHIIVPSILVQLVIALRLSFSFTFVGVILVGLIASKSGLGLILQNTMEIFDPDTIMAVATVIVVIATAINLTLYAIQRLLEARWNLTDQSNGGKLE